MKERLLWLIRRFPMQTSLRRDLRWGQIQIQEQKASALAGAMLIACLRQDLETAELRRSEFLWESAQFKDMMDRFSNDFLL